MLLGSRHCGMHCVRGGGRVSHLGSRGPVLFFLWAAKPLLLLVGHAGPGSLLVQFYGGIGCGCVAGIKHQRCGC
jgi:hypothetical protein